MHARAPGGEAGRVLCFTLPITGHVTPLLPLVRALTGAGTQVEVVTGAGLADRFRAAGSSVHLLPAPFADAVARPSENFLEVAALLARWTGETLLGDADRLVRACAPDLVLVDSMAPWGRLAARRAGIPVVTATSSFLIDARLGASPQAALDVLRRAGRAAGALGTIVRTRLALRRREGLDPGGPLTLLSNRGDATLVFTSRELQPAGDRFPDDVHFVGPTAAGQGDAVDPSSALGAALAEAAPIGYVALGTVYWDRPAFLAAAAWAVDGAGLRPVVALGPGLTAADLGPLPAGALTVHDAPQRAILDHADLFVTHGGVNGVHEALWRGVPMVVHPQAADQPVVAGRLARLGAAAVVRGRDPSPDALNRAIGRALEPRVRATARRLGDGLRTAGGTDAAARVVHEAAAGSRAGATRRPAS